MERTSESGQQFCPAGITYIMKIHISDDVQMVSEDLKMLHEQWESLRVYSEDYQLVCII